MLLPSCEENEMEGQSDTQATHMMNRLMSPGGIRPCSFRPWDHHTRQRREYFVITGTMCLDVEVVPFQTPAKS